MALAGVPPWESFTPFDFVNAAASGARLGLERAGQTLGADEASGRLGLGYAQLAGENARAGMAAAAESRRAAAADAFRQMEFQNSLQQWQQEQALKQKAEADLTNYRQGQLQSKDFMDQLHLANALGLVKKPEPQIKTVDLPGGRQAHYMFSPGTGVGSWMPATTENPTVPRPKGGLTPYQGMTLRNNFQKQIDSLTAGTTFGTLDGDPDPQWNQRKKDQFNALKARKADLEKRMQQLDLQMTAPGADLGTPNATPPTDDGSGVDDPLGILGSTNAPASPNE